MSCDRLGSRVVEAFITSAATASQKKCYFKKFVGYFADLACERYGSFCVEKWYGVVDVPSKRLIAKELAAKERRLGSSISGRKLLQALKIEEYKEKEEDWVRKRNAVDTTKRLFADILGGEEENKAPKKAKKNSSEEEVKESKKAKKSSTEDLFSDILEDKPSKKAKKSSTEDLFADILEDKKESKKVKKSSTEELFADIFEEKNDSKKSKKKSKAPDSDAVSEPESEVVSQPKKSKKKSKSQESDEEPEPEIVPQPKKSNKKSKESEPEPEPEKPKKKKSKHVN
eukprot:TRINITY_DN3470_c0_g1_i5.p1 TRINITY_DN3470_c0_g1~~TRINITY_DN3470_c0_g1_i5.p1  ORF type:complete len:285 (-),score=73.77 TRINITY_DN3470_c0_g1_i5:44-898(-)